MVWLLTVHSLAVSSGLSASLLAKYRPAVPILTITRNSTTARQLSLHRGCYTFWVRSPFNPLQL